MLLLVLVISVNLVLQQSIIIIIKWLIHGRFCLLICSVHLEWFQLFFCLLHISYVCACACACSPISSSLLCPPGNRLGTGIAIRYTVGTPGSYEAEIVKMTVNEGQSKKAGMAWIAAMQKVCRCHIRAW